MNWDSCVDNGVATLKCVPVIFNNIVYAALLFAGVVALFIIIYSGFQFVTSGGDPKQVEGAKKTATYAIIGLVVILLSFFIINMIGFITGTNCISKFGFDSCG